MAVSLMKKGFLLISIPLVFEISLVSLLLDMHDKMIRESERVTRARQISVIINKLVKVDIDLEDGLDTIENPIMMARSIDSHFIKILDYFFELEILTRPEPALHERLQLAFVEMKAIKNQLLMLRMQLVSASGSQPIKLAHVLAPQFKTRIRNLVNLGFLEIADDYAKVLETDNTGALQEQTAQLLRLAVAISILIAAASSFYITTNLARRLRVTSINATRLGNKIPLIEHNNADDEIGRVDAALDHAAATISELDSNREEIVSMVSHDIRTPVSAIKLASQYLEEATEIGPEEKQAIFEIEGNCDRILNISRDLIDLQRWEAGMLFMSEEECSLNNILTSALQSVKSICRKRGVDIIFKGAEITVIADPARLEQVLTNLLSNALKNSPVHSTVELSARKSTFDKRVSIMVADRGCGIDPAQIEHIFVKFRQTRSSDSRSGTGLGLTITKALVELNNGEIHCENREGGGCLFTVILPT